MKVILRNTIFTFILWLFAFGCVNAAHKAPHDSILEIFWAISSIVLFIGMLGSIVGTIVFLIDDDHD